MNPSLITRHAGFKFALTSEILQYRAPEEDLLDRYHHRNYLRVVDQALPQGMFSHMQQGFAEDSPFWIEHNYCVLPASDYFSYVLDVKKKPATTLEEILQHVKKIVAQHFPEVHRVFAISCVMICVILLFQVQRATHAEWWAHCRPHASGHQLHFDSEDEGKGTVRHPIMSTVLYLTEGIGGPTLVTNQRLGDMLPEKAWLAHPGHKKCIKTLRQLNLLCCQGSNRLTMFKGDLLHGVVPGVSVVLIKINSWSCSKS